MELKIVREEENPLLNRKKVVYESFGKTPKKQEALEKIAALSGKDKKAVSIKRISQAYGSNTSVIEANVYNSVEDRMKCEPLKKEEGKANEAKE